MSKIGYCKRGGLEGILVTTKELEAFAKKHGHKYIDWVIPIPGAGNQPHPDNCPHTADHDNMDNITYWETETGAHGWCCQSCGLVIQWG